MPVRSGRAAAILGVHRNTIDYWVRTGRLRAWRVGPRGHYRIEVEDILALREEEA